MSKTAGVVLSGAYADRAVVALRIASALGHLESHATTEALELLDRVLAMTGRRTHPR